MSRKRSGSRRRTRPPRAICYFVDRDLGPTFAESLRQAGFEAVAHRQVYPEETSQDAVSDPTWIEMASKNGWVCLTSDDEIRRDTAARSTVWRVSARIFVVTTTGQVHHKARVTIDARAQIERLLDRHRGPFIATISLRTVSTGGGISSKVEVRVKTAGDDLVRHRRKKGRRRQRGLAGRT